MKNIRHSFLLLAVTFFLSAVTSAQYSVNEMRISNADVDLIKKTPLVVVLLDENALYIKKLERKENAEELAKYKKIINDFNNNIGHMISKELPFIKAEYKHLEEIKKMTVQERQKLNFLTYNIGAVLYINLAGPGLTAKISTFDFYSKEVFSPLEKSSYDFEEKDAPYSKLEIYSFDKKNKCGKVTFFKTFNQIAPTIGDVSYWLKRANYIIQTVSKEGESAAGKKKVSENTHHLKEKTLLICKDDLHENTTEEAIKKSYPFAYKLLSKNEMDSMILSSDPTSCVLMIAPLENPIPFFSQEIMDLSSGLIAGIGISSGIAGAGGSAYKKVKEDHLKKYAQAASK